MPSTSVREGQGATLYAVCPVRVIHSDVELWRPVRVRRSSRIVPLWEPPGDVDLEVMRRLLAGLRGL